MYAASVEKDSTGSQVVMLAVLAIFKTLGVGGASVGAGASAAGG